MEVKLTLSEFIKFQAKGTLCSNETIADYIYDKDTVIDKAPFTIQNLDKLSLILQGIIKHKWAISLITAVCVSIKDLLDRAIQLNVIKKCQYVE